MATHEISYRTLFQAFCVLLREYGEAQQDAAECRFSDAREGRLHDGDVSETEYQTGCVRVTPEDRLDAVLSLFTRQFRRHRYRVAVRTYRHNIEDGSDAGHGQLHAPSLKCCKHIASREPRPTRFFLMLIIVGL